MKVATGAAPDVPPFSTERFISMSDEIRHGFKVFTHDWRPPVQGGAPLLTEPGTLPFTLPAVTLDTSSEECAAGYNYAASLTKAVSVAGFWRHGRPAKLVAVTASSDAIERRSKRRTSVLTVDRFCTEIEIQAAMRELVTPWAEDATDALVAEQWAWWIALGRPLCDEAKVVKGLQEALACRSLSWRLKRFDTARDAWDALDAWAAWDAWGAWAAWAARNARDAWAARNAWAAWDAWGAWGAWAARGAWDALAIHSAVSCGWLSSYNANHLTVGIRDAYHHGLGTALPTGPNELGYAMDKEAA